MASNDESSATNNNTTNNNVNNNEHTSSTSNNEAAGGGGSWWSGFIKSAKEKSINAIEFMKNDLAEFKTTMTTDTSKLVSQASEQLKETTGAVSLLDTLSKSINLNLNLNFLNEDTAEKIVVGKTTKSSLASDHPNTAMNIHERFKQELRQLQSNENTFLTNPTSATSDNDYDDWEACFNSDNYKSAISDLLIENSSLRLLYSQLVPAQISNNQFWSRYFFKVNQLEEDYKKRVKLIQKATTNQIEAVNKEETLDWDDDESSNDVSMNTNEESNNQRTQTSSKKSLAGEETTSTSTTATINDDVQSSVSGVENPSLELNTQSNEILKSAASSSSQIDVKSIELSIDGQELANKLTETSVPKSTTEDSDEWEKVSDVALSEVNEKKSANNVEADVTLTDSVEKLTKTNQHQEESSGEEIESDTPHQQQQPSTEQQSTSATSESKTNENKKKAENDWEDWDE